MLGTQNFQYLPTYQPAFIAAQQAPAPLLAAAPQPFVSNIPAFGPNNSLTHIQSPPPDCQPVHRKRPSFDMEEDEHFGDEPPAKQLLSESKLFKQFGSLQIDPSQMQANSQGSPTTSSADSDDSLDNNEKALTLASTAQDNREEFKRYVYLLYMDRNRSNNSQSTAPTTSNPSFSFDNLLREEREKLSKAVVLWNPSLQSGISQENNSDSDEDFTYTDHRDFLRHNTTNSSTLETTNSVVITEVTDDDFEMMATEDSVQPNTTATPSHYDPDDVMIL